VEEHGIDLEVLAVGAGCILLWALTARRLARWNVSSAMAMVVLGLLVANRPLDLIDPTPTSSTVQLFAELALALVLFSDASRVNLRGLRSDPQLPARLLLVGLPLTIAFGFGTALILTDLDPWLCAVVAATLAPTDAALGAPVVADPHVPRRIRQTLNVESGLNDGMVTPLVTFFLAGAVAEADALSGFTPASALWDLALGVLVGAVLGAGGGRVLGIARERSWTSPSATAIFVPALAFFAYGTALQLEGNGFVAAFVGGLFFGSTQRDAAEIGELGEQVGELLGLVVWLIFGSLMLDVITDVTWGMVAFAVLSLTALRMVPVALSLSRSGLSRYSVGFVAWFGPRGLASIVFGVLALDALPAADGDQVVSIVVLTVLMSVVLHGLTARPLSLRYGARSSGLGTSRPEHLQVPGHRPSARHIAEHDESADTGGSHPSSA
jgi:NhaP-type Na+/H+ or K+/H+ antiporter